MSVESGLKSVFAAFITFGDRNASNEAMDGKKFAKLCKDCSLLDSKLTATDVDLVFANVRVKPKNERKITFSQFLVACELLAEKKYPRDSAGVEKLHNLIISARPENSGTVADNDSTLQKMTDTSLYTGSHKERFDSNGNGLGLAGRDSIAKGGVSKSDLSNITDRSEADIRGVKQTTSTTTVKKSPSGTLQKSPSSSASTSLQPSQYNDFGQSSSSSSASSVGKDPMTNRLGGTGGGPPTKLSSSSSSSSSLSSSAKATQKSSSTSSTSKPSIFDKLTDSSQYTGSHKHRFDANGNGRGLAGRDSIGKGGVGQNDLSKHLDRSAADVRGVKYSSSSS